MRHFVKFTSYFSVRDYVHLGSTLSVANGPIVLRDAVVNVHANCRMGSNFSLLDFAEVGSCFSIRALGMVGHTLSVFNDAALGSALSSEELGILWNAAERRQQLDVTGGSSLASWAACMSCLSVKGYTRMNSVTSVLSEVSLSSSLSVRSFARIGGMVSAQTNACVNGSLGRCTSRTLQPAVSRRLHSDWIDVVCFRTLASGIVSVCEKFHASRIWPFGERPNQRRRCFPVHWAHRT